jgi:putative transposase
LESIQIWGLCRSSFILTRQITLVTTRLDAEVYRIADLAEWSRRCWQVETALAHLKTTMQMEGFHGNTVPGVLKELTVFATGYNFVRMVMRHSATLRPITVDRISFLDALRWLDAPSSGMPLIALIVNPSRPRRMAPRVKKR